MRQRLTTICIGMLVVLMTGVSIGQAQTVADFTIMGPQVVLDDNQDGEVTFTVYVAAADSNWRPILPGESATINLTAFEAGTQNQLTITAGSSFQSSDAVIWNPVQVTVTGVTNSLHIAFQAEGYGIGPSGSNAPGTRVADMTGSDTNHFQINAPHSANPNEPFPIIITPTQAEQNEPDSKPAAFNGTVDLTVDEGTISPTSVALDLQAGESHVVMVTLDAVSPSNKVHVRFEVQSTPTPQHDVVFTNENQLQLGNGSNFSVHPEVYQDDTPLSAGPNGVTTSSPWNSSIWPIEENESQQFAGGWNMMTFIDGVGVNSHGIQFHDMFIPKVGPQGTVEEADLPGLPAFWHDYTIALGEGGWNIVSGTFPAGLAGEYWHRRVFLSRGQFPKLTMTFDHHSAMFDQVLKLVEVDGTPDNDQQPLSSFGVKGTTWTADLFRTEASSESGAPVFHMLAAFDVNDGPVTTFLSFTPSSRQTPGLSGNSFPPDAEWNQNYATQPGEFQNASGDALPADFTTGTFWNRIRVIRSPGGSGGSHEGWSQSINTTGQHVVTTQLKIQNTLALPGDLAELFVVLEHPDRDVAGIQFDVPVPQNTTFLGAINFHDAAGFSINANTSEGKTTFLMTNLGGGRLDARENDILMKLIYQVESGATIGDGYAVELQNTVLSDPSSNAIEHGTEDGSIIVERIGDLAGDDGILTVTDLVALVDIIIGTGSQPEPGSIAFAKADINEDEAINILDALRVINIIIGKATAKQVAGVTEPVRLQMGDVHALTQGRMTLPVQIQSDGPISGLQLTLKYDPSLMSPGTVIPDARLNGMLIEQHASAGELKILVVSPDGGSFTASTLSAILELPVVLHGDQAGEMQLAEVIIADAQAAAMQTIVTRDRARVSTTPGAFALIGNQPNPFNPSTQIAYEVAEQSHITLTVFNLLGQEVVRLVDQVQTAGRYTVTWNARNANGQSVSSGVYLYRLTSSTGAVDSRRMTLLK